MRRYRNQAQEGTHSPLFASLRKELTPHKAYFWSESSSNSLLLFQIRNYLKVIKMVKAFFSLYIYDFTKATLIPSILPLCMGRIRFPPC